MEQQEDEVVQKVNSLRKGLLSIQIQGFAKESSIESLQDAVRKLQQEMDGIRSVVQSNDPLFDMIDSAEKIKDWFNDGLNKVSALRKTVVKFFRNSKASNIHATVNNPVVETSKDVSQKSATKTQTSSPSQPQLGVTQESPIITTTTQNISTSSPSLNSSSTSLNNTNSNQQIICDSSSSSLSSEQPKLPTIQEVLDLSKPVKNDNTILASNPPIPSIPQKSKEMPAILLKYLNKTQFSSQNFTNKPNEEQKKENLTTSPPIVPSDVAKEVSQQNDAPIHQSKESKNMVEILVHQSPEMKNEHNQMTSENQDLNKKTSPNSPEKDQTRISPPYKTKVNLKIETNPFNDQVKGFVIKEKKDVPPKPPERTVLHIANERKPDNPKKIEPQSNNNVRLTPPELPKRSPTLIPQKEKDLADQVLDFKKIELEKELISKKINSQQILEEVSKEIEKNVQKTSIVNPTSTAPESFSSFVALLPENPQNSNLNQNYVGNPNTTMNEYKFEQNRTVVSGFIEELDSLRQNVFNSTIEMMNLRLETEKMADFEDSIENELNLSLFEVKQKHYSEEIQDLRRHVAHLEMKRNELIQKKEIREAEQKKEEDKEKLEQEIQKMIAQPKNPVQEIKKIPEIIEKPKNLIEKDKKLPIKPSTLENSLEKPQNINKLSERILKFEEKTQTTSQNAEIQISVIDNDGNNLTMSQNQEQKPETTEDQTIPKTTFPETIFKSSSDIQKKIQEALSQHTKEKENLFIDPEKLFSENEHGGFEMFAIPIPKEIQNQNLKVPSQKPVLPPRNRQQNQAPRPQNENNTNLETKPVKRSPPVAQQQPIVKRSPQQQQIQPRSKSTGPAIVSQSSKFVNNNPNSIKTPPPRPSTSEIQNSSNKQQQQKPALQKYNSLGEISNILSPQNSFVGDKSTITENLEFLNDATSKNNTNSSTNNNSNQNPHLDEKKAEAQRFLALERAKKAARKLKENERLAKEEETKKQQKLQDLEKKRRNHLHFLQQKKTLEVILSNAFPENVTNSSAQAQIQSNSHSSSEKLIQNDETSQNISSHYETLIDGYDYNNISGNTPSNFNTNYNENQNPDEEEKKKQKEIEENMRRAQKRAALAVKREEEKKKKEEEQKKQKKNEKWKKRDENLKKFKQKQQEMQQVPQKSQISEENDKIYVPNTKSKSNQKKSSSPIVLQGSSDQRNESISIIDDNAVEIVNLPNRTPPKKQEIKEIHQNNTANLSKKNSPEQKNQKLLPNAHNTQSSKKSSPEIAAINPPPPPIPPFNPNSLNFNPKNEQKPQIFNKIQQKPEKIPQKPVIIKQGENENKKNSESKPQKKFSSPFKNPNKIPKKTTLPKFLEVTMEEPVEEIDIDDDEEGESSKHKKPQSKQRKPAQSNQSFPEKTAPASKKHKEIQKLKQQNEYSDGNSSIFSSGKKTQNSQKNSFLELEEDFFTEEDFLNFVTNNSTSLETSSHHQKQQQPQQQQKHEKIVNDDDDDEDEDDDEELFSLAELDDNTSALINTLKSKRLENSKIPVAVSPKFSLPKKFEKQKQAKNRFGWTGK